jgi:hypothetical protein
MSLVEDSTHTTPEVSLSDDSDFSAENAPIAFVYYCYVVLKIGPKLCFHEGKHTSIQRN